MFTGLFLRLHSIKWVGWRRFSYKDTADLEGAVDSNLMW